MAPRRRTGTCPGVGKVKESGGQLEELVSYVAGRPEDGHGVAPPQPSAGDSADARMTAEREETKYLVPPARWERAGRRAVAAPARRTASRAQAPTACPTPTTTSRRSTSTRPRARCFAPRDAALDHNLKVRAKEYYDLHPSLAELATDPAQIVRYQPWLWFEIKRREGSRTRKQRFRLPKGDVALFFAEGRVTRRRVRCSPRREGDSLRDAMRTLPRARRAAVERLPGQLPALSWQSDEAELRVTFDRGLASFAPPADLWARRQALVRSALGGCGRRRSRAACWRSSAGAGARMARRGAGGRIGATPVPFSKFVTAFRAVQAHG